MGVQNWHNQNQRQVSNTGVGLSQEEINKIKEDIKTEVLEGLTTDISATVETEVTNATKGINTEITNIKEEIDTVTKAGTGD